LDETSEAALEARLTTPEIVQKVSDVIAGGIDSEVEVVYALAGFRKLIERYNLKKKFPMLNFHCNWALHSRLSWSAEDIISVFENVHQILRDPANGDAQLSPELKRELDQISEMRTFKLDLERFSERFGLPQVEDIRADGWAKFLYLYSRVISDIPLTVDSEDDHGPPDHVRSVIVTCETAPVDHPGGREVVFRIRWTIYPRGGKPAVHDVYNSYAE
jgi:hypothetical protein